MNSGSLPPWASGYSVCACAVGSLIPPASGTGCSALRARPGGLRVSHGRRCTLLRWMQLCAEVRARAGGGTKRWFFLDLVFEMLLSSDSGGRLTHVSLVLHIR